MTCACGRWRAPPRQIASWRWAPLSLAEPGLTARTSFDAATQQVVNQVGGAAGSITAGQVITTDLPVPSCALWFSGAREDSVNLLTAARIDSSAATLECWMKMSAAAGVAAAGQTLLAVEELGDLAPQFAYAGNDALSFSWHGISYRSADTRAVSDGAWHHVAVVFNQNYVTIYKTESPLRTCSRCRVQPSEGLLVIGGALGSMAAFNGELYDIRVWDTPHTTAQISSFRYVTLTGDEPSLTALCNLSGMNPAQPRCRSTGEQLRPRWGPRRGGGGAATAAVAGQCLDLPGFPRVAGRAAAVAAGCCSPNATDGTAGAFLRSVELETGQVRWSYDVRPESELTSVVIPAAVGTDGQTAYTGVQSPYKDTTVNFVEIHAVNVATGEPVWQQPARLEPAMAFLTRPVVLGGVLYAGVEGLSSGGLAWGDPASGTMQVKFFAEPQQEGAAQFMTEPVVDATSVYIGRNAAATGPGPAKPWSPRWRLICSSGRSPGR